MTVEELGRVGFWSKCKYRMSNSTTTMGEEATQEDGGVTVRKSGSKWLY